MEERLTAAGLIGSHQELLALQWLAGRSGAMRCFTAPSSLHNPMENITDLVGYMNPCHPCQIQIIGQAESSYLQGLDEQARRTVLSKLFAEQSALVIVADNVTASEELCQFAEDHSTPLFESRMPGNKLISHLQYYLTDMLAEKMTLHGVFMEVMGVGVLIVGESRIGKSELALELISRGHRLIADDAPEFSRVAPNVIRGVCPELLDGFLEVRGLGVLNVRAMFGDKAIKRSKYLRLIISLTKMQEDTVWEVDRLHGSRKHRTLFEIAVPEITLPVAPGRNLAVLVESAALNHLQMMKGYDAARDFIARQQQLIAGADK